MPPKALVRADRFIRDEVSNIPRSRRREAKALTMCLVMFFCLLAPGNIADRLTEFAPITDAVSESWWTAAFGIVTALWALGIAFRGLRVLRAVASFAAGFLFSSLAAMMIWNIPQSPLGWALGLFFTPFAVSTFWRVSRAREEEKSLP